MRLYPIVIVIFLIFTSDSSGQTRIITGKIISEKLKVIRRVRIQTSDTTLLGRTDIHGQFKIEIPFDTRTLLIVSTGSEWTTINLTKNCDHLDIILMDRWTYIDVVPDTPDRDRRQRFSKLPWLHHLAFSKGLFIDDKPCYGQPFMPTDATNTIGSLSPSKWD